MPIFDLFTNLPAERIPKDIGLRATRLIAEIAQRPIDRIQVSIHPNCDMMMNETTEPTARFVLGDIYSIAPENTRQRLGEAMTKLGTEDLGIASNRFFIRFIDVNPGDVMTEGKFLTEWLILRAAELKTAAAADKA